MTKRKYPERKSSYQRLSSAFRSVIDNFKIAASKTDKRETTIQAEANNGSAFLLCLQDQGAKTLNDVTTTMIQNSSLTERGKSEVTPTKTILWLY